MGKRKERRASKRKREETGEREMKVKPPRAKNSGYGLQLTANYRTMPVCCALKA